MNLDGKNSNLKDSSCFIKGVMRLSSRLNVGCIKRSPLIQSKMRFFLLLYNAGHIDSFVLKTFITRSMRCDAALFFTLCLGILYRQSVFQLRMQIYSLRWCSCNWQSFTTSLRGNGYPLLWPSANCREPLDVSNEFTFQVIEGILSGML